MTRSITEDEIYQIENLIVDDEGDPQSHDTWSLDPQIAADYNILAANISPNGAWWAEVEETFEHSAESEMDGPADQKATRVLADPTLWEVVSTGNLDGLRWSAFVSFDVHEGQAFALVTSDDGSTALALPYIL